MLNNCKAERGERITLRRILGNQTVRFRGGWHWPRTVPMTDILISSSETVGPATSSELAYIWHGDMENKENIIFFLLEAPISVMFIG